MPSGKGTKSDSNTTNKDTLAKAQHNSADLEPPPRVRTNGGVGNDYYAMLEEDDDGPQNTSKSPNPGVQAGKKVSRTGSSRVLKSLFGLKSSPQASVEVPWDEALLDNSDDCLHNDDVAMRVDSYVDYQALAASHQQRQGRFLRKFSRS